MNPLNITPEQIIELIPKSTSLTYIDYRDSLDNQTSVINECVRNNSLDELYMEVDEQYLDNRLDSVYEYIKDLKNKLVDEFDITEEETDDLVAEHRDLIDNTIHDRDDSTPVKDLIRNTSDFVFFYDTGETSEIEWNSTEAELRLQRYRIKKLLGISTSKYDKDIEDMLQNASYGGRLVVYFQSPFEELIKEEHEFNTIKFTNAHIAAENPLSAALDVSNYVRDNGGTFNVRDMESGDAFTVDLDELPEDAVLPDKNSESWKLNG